MAGGGGSSVPLAALQGEWVASRGEVIRVEHADLTINGRTMPGGLKLSADGTQVVGFGIYRVALSEGQAAKPELDGLVWQAGMQEIIWRRPAAGEVSARTEFMSAHMGDTAPPGFNAASEGEAVARLNALLQRWSEGPLVRVRSCDICPDWTNRAETGLSVDHVHYVATLIQTNGFKSRRRGLGTEEGAHDVPVLVREARDSELGRGAVRKWGEATAANPGFPPFMLGDRGDVFCSLGNGHFSQALNLFRAGAKSLWTNRVYAAGGDEALREALEDGVESVVLSNEMPRADRQFVSEMLNRSHGRSWRVGADGRAHVEEEGSAATSAQFVALSKVLDAEELSCLVRQKLGVDVDGKVMDKRQHPVGGRLPDKDAEMGADAGAAMLHSRL